MRHLLCGLLICTPTLAQDPKTPATKERYEALIREYDAAEEAWLKRLDGGGDTVARRAWPGSSFAPRFLELAEAAPDDPAATDALLWVANRAMNVGAGDERLYPHYCRAIKLLAQGRHLDDARVGRACTQGLRYASAPTESLLRLLSDRSRDREVRGRATLALGNLLYAKAMIARAPWLRADKKSPSEEAFFKRLNPDHLDYLRETDPGKSEGEAEVVFERAIKNYGDVIYHRSSGRGDRDVTIADAARSALHKLRDLAIGKVAPEIEGVDIDGRPLKLSDHRGKVVVLTFWATWCGPCMELVPHERALVERLAGKPFVLLGISGDEDRERAKRAVVEERITWKSWWNGGPTGPITETFSVEGWPTVYVLDARGTIRSKEVFEKKLDEAVDALLKEMEVVKRQP
jgi:thiol-disulfide isomerase/thioredoxin